MTGDQGRHDHRIQIIKIKLFLLADSRVDYFPTEEFLMTFSFRRIQSSADDAHI